MHIKISKREMILSIILGVVFGVLWTINILDGYFDFWLFVVCFVGLTLVCTLFLGMVFSVVSLVVPRDTIVEREVKIYELVSLSDVRGDSLSGKGSYFIFSGYMSVEGKTYQAFSGYIRKGDGYKLEEWEADKSIIYEGEETPRVVSTQKKTTKTIKDVWYKKFLSFGDDVQISMNYKIYIPKGSIMNSFDLDSK